MASGDVRHATIRLDTSHRAAAGDEKAGDDPGSTSDINDAAPVVGQEVIGQEFVEQLRGITGAGSVVPGGVIAERARPSSILEDHPEILTCTRRRNLPTTNHAGDARLDGDHIAVNENLSELEELLRSRRDQRPTGSYSAELFADRERLLRKIMEEAFEICLELGRPVADKERVAEEAADLVFHLLVGLVSVDVSVADVGRVLEERR